MDKPTKTNIINENFSEHLAQSIYIKIEVELIIDNTKDLAKIISFLLDISRFVQKLIIHNANVYVLSNNTFAEFQNVEFLILDNIQPLDTIYAETLKPFSNNIKILEINQIKLYSNGLRNLTGSIELPQLKNVSFAYCLIPAITHDAFLGLLNVSYIFLTNCQIEHISIGAFDAVQDTILYIDLSNNYLMSVDGMFTNWYQIKNTSLQINFKNNPIDCYEMKNFDNFSRSLMFVDEMCQHVLLPKMKLKQNEAITCDAEGHLQFDDYNYNDSEEAFQWIITTNVTDGTVLIENSKKCLDTVLLWLDKDTTNSSIGCLHSNNESFYTINDLKPETVYTFCAMQEKKSTVSPYNCLPYYHLPHKLSNLWISSKQRTLVISLMIVVYICCIIIGTVIAYFILKKYPTLLKGGNGVVVVRNSTEFMQKTISAQ